MPTNQVTRRTFTATAAGIAAGVFARPLLAANQADATPVAGIEPYGFASTRLRMLHSPDDRDQINELVRDEFVPEVESLEGFAGYLLGDVIDEADQNLSVVVFEEQAQADAFDEVAAEFVASVDEMVDAEATRQWAGDLLMLGAPADRDADPEAAPVTLLTEGYVALRVHTSLPGTDPREFVPLAVEGFLPIVTGLPGFEGYLWYPTEGGFVAISLFDSVEAAEASNEAAKDWAVEYLPEYTDGDPLIINANVVYAHLPILDLD